MFLADVKGDLGGMALPGSPLAKSPAMLVQRAADCGIAGDACASFPMQFPDMFADQGTSGNCSGSDR